MDGEHERFYGDAGVLYQRAVRIPLPDEDAERLFHENVARVATAQERKADLLEDPDVPLAVAYEESLDLATESYERRLERIAGGDYADVAMAYYRGDREDRIAEVVAYIFEGIWRIQQRTTVTEMVFTPLVLRYPDCFTMNMRFASGYTTPESIHYESPEHSCEDVGDEYAETYYEESQYSQREAAAYLREAAEVMREEFPHPDETSFEERKYGGYVSAGGRRGSVFSALFKRVDPDPDRFAEPATEPTLVEAGPEARRTECELGLDGELVQ